MRKIFNNYTLGCILTILTFITFTCFVWKTFEANYNTAEEIKVEKPVIKTEVYTTSIETEQELPSEEVLNQKANEPEWGFDFEYICRVVAAESRGEPYEGQVAVARCIWNSAINKGMTMEQIVELPNRYADPVSSELVTEELRNACMDAFLGMNLPTEEDIEYFYSTKGGFVSNWHENALEHVITIGNHKFFKEK